MYSNEYKKGENEMKKIVKKYSLVQNCMKRLKMI